MHTVSIEGVSPVLQSIVVNTITRLGGSIVSVPDAGTGDIMGAFEQEEDARRCTRVLEAVKHILQHPGGA
jgi:hypothetical protein